MTESHTADARMQALQTSLLRHHRKFNTKTESQHFFSPSHYSAFLLFGAFIAVCIALIWHWVSIHYRISSVRATNHGKSGAPEVRFPMSYGSIGTVECYSKCSEITVQESNAATPKNFVVVLENKIQNGPEIRNGQNSVTALNIVQNCGLSLTDKVFSGECILYDDTDVDSVESLGSSAIVINQKLPEHASNVDLDKIVNFVVSNCSCPPRYVHHNTRRENMGEEDFDDIAFDGVHNDLAQRLSGRKLMELEQWRNETRLMEFDRDRVSWRGNEAVLDDPDWTDADCEDLQTDPLTATLASMASTGQPPWLCNASCDGRRRRSDSDTDPGSPGPFRGSVGSISVTEFSGTGEIHTPRNVAAADLAFSMGHTLVETLRRCHSSGLDVHCWYREGLSPWEGSSQV